MQEGDLKVSLLAKGICFRAEREGGSGSVREGYICELQVLIFKGIVELRRSKVLTSVFLKAPWTQGMEVTSLLLPKGKLFSSLGLDSHALVWLVAVVAPQGSVTQKGSINYVSPAKEERQ